MMANGDAAPSRRSYDSPRRREQAEVTRQRIAAAARTVFMRDGWAGTTVDAVAAEAGVSVATVYKTYRTKRGLAAAVADAANLSADLARLQAHLESAEPDPSRDLAAMVAYDCRLYRNAGDLLLLLRSTRGQLPDLEDAYAKGREAGDTIRRQRFESWPASALRPGVSVTHAVDVYAAICNFDAYQILLDERGWTPARVEEWWVQVVCELILSLAHWPARSQLPR